MSWELEGGRSDSYGFEEAYTITSLADLAVADFAVADALDTDHWVIESSL